MKKKVIICLLFIILSFPEAVLSQLSFRIFAGKSLIHGGDLNQNIYGWSEYFKDRNQAPYTFDYNLKELHSFLEGGVDLAYNFSHRWSAALSIELLEGTTHGEMSSSMNDEQDYFHSPGDSGTIYLNEQSLQEPKYHLQTIPVSITIFYSFPFRDNMNFFLGCGVGYYSGKINYRENYQYDFDYIDEKNNNGVPVSFVDKYSSSGSYYEESRCKTFGFHLRGGLEYKIRSGIHLIVEAAGRMVEFKEWKGNKNDSFSWDHTWGYWGAYSDKDSLKEAAEGKLWMVTFHSEKTGKSYPRFIFSDEKPSSYFYTEVRPARINLNGLSLRAGIKISF